MDQITNQQLQLLAQKALVMEQLKAIETQLGQLAAIAQFIKANEPKDTVPEPQAPAE